MVAPSRRPGIWLALLGAGVVLFVALRRDDPAEEARAPAPADAQSAAAEPASAHAGDAPSADAPPGGGVPTQDGDTDGRAVPAPSILPGSNRHGIAPDVQTSVARLDARLDGWDTEVLSSQALGELKKAGKAFAHAGRHGEKEARAIAADGFAGTRLRPEPLAELPTSGALRVWRWRRGADAAERVHRGADGLVAALAEWTAPFAPDAELVVEFKSIKVELAEREFRMLARAQLSGAGPLGRVQSTAFWRTRWQLVPETKPRLVEIELESHEEALAPAQNGPLFIDATAWVLSGAQTAAQQLARSSDHWAGRLDRALGQSFVGHEGLAVGDADGDGLEDLYLCQGGGVPNRLFLQGSDGRLRDVSEDSGADVLDPTRSALFVDLDGDADLDLVLGGEAVTVLENTGAARFRKAWRVAATTVTSMAAADYDLDGDLDLYACRYTWTEGTAPKPYHDANNGAPNLLLRNDGEWKFVDATVESGLDENNHRFSFACAWCDFDDDGDPDLYVANDFGRKNLYVNDKGRFRDRAAELGVEDIGAGMSAAWGDYDRDGRFDLYVGNMFSSAGNRVTFQPRFQPDAGAGTQAQFQRHARGNSLFKSLGARGFEDASEAAGVTLGRWAWSSLFADVDDDGLEDLLVANGYLTNEDPDDL